MLMSQDFLCMSQRIALYFVPFDDLGIFACLVHSLVVVELALIQDPKGPLGHDYLKTSQ